MRAVGSPGVRAVFCRPRRCNNTTAIFHIYILALDEALLSALIALHGCRGTWNNEWGSWFVVDRCLRTSSSVVVRDRLIYITSYDMLAQGGPLKYCCTAVYVYVSLVPNANVPPFRTSQYSGFLCTPNAHFADYSRFLLTRCFRGWCWSCRRRRRCCLATGKRLQGVCSRQCGANQRAHGRIVIPSSLYVFAVEGGAAYTYPYRT